MIREDHVRFCEGPRVQLPRPTHPDFRLRLYWEQFRLIILPVPPLDEQRRIADAAQREINYAAQVAAKVSASLERLKERRAALITAAVTGQIEVRAKTAAGKSKPDRAMFRVIVGAEIIHRTRIAQNSGG